MVVGLIGSGNMARALALGWGLPVLCTDGGSGRAKALAAEVGGEALRSNAELAERSDVVVLAHKPYQLDAVAKEIAGRADAVASLLARTPASRLAAALAGSHVFRLMPNTPVEVRQGVTLYAPTEDVDAGAEARVLDLFRRVGEVVEVDEAQLEVAAAVMSVGPAYFALIAEAWADAAVRRGLKPAVASELVRATMGGTAALLEARGNDTLAVRRAVTSPGGTTARGLASLEHDGVRAAFHRALDAVLDDGP